MDAVASYLAQVCRETPPTAAEELALHEAGKRDALITRNTRLVVSVAKRYTGNGVPFRDLIQEGIVGLIEAIDGWDPNRGRLSTYAVPRIRRAIVTALKEDRAMTVPRNAVDDIGRIARARHTLTQALGRKPTTEEVAKEVGLDIEYIQSLDTAGNVTSLDLTLEGGGPILALLGEDGIEERALMLTVVGRTQELDDGVRELVERHWLDGDSYRTLADDYPYSREKIRQLCLDGLERLREMLGVQ